MSLNTPQKTHVRSEWHFDQNSPTLVNERSYLWTFGFGNHGVTTVCHTGALFEAGCATDIALMAVTWCWKESLPLIAHKKATVIDDGHFKSSAGLKV